MAHSRYYTPRLDRDLVTALFHTAKSHGIPMTRLASSLVREGLARLGRVPVEETSVTAEVAPVSDPDGLK